MAFAGEDYTPTTYPALHAIDVHGLHLAKTVQVGVLRMNIEDHDFVGSMTLGRGCSHPLNLSLDAYELVTKNKYGDLSAWVYNLHSVQKIVAAEMEQAGYPKYDPDLSLFEMRLGSDADFRIAMTLNDLHFKKCNDFFMRHTEGIGNINATWEVYSQREQKVVYSKSVFASIEAPSGKEVDDREFNRRLIAQMVDNILADPEFVAVFK